MVTVEELPSSDRQENPTSLPGFQDGAREVYSLVIVGAGVGGLYVAARLPDEVLKRTLVVDKHGEWLPTFLDEHQRIGTRFLRTPVNQSPHADPSALRDYAKAKGLGSTHTKPLLPGFLPLPSAELFERFCKEKIVGALPVTAKVVAKDTAVSVEGLSAEEAARMGFGGRGCRIAMASGRVVFSRAVVFTGSAKQPIVPRWAAPYVRHCWQGSDAPVHPTGGETIAVAHPGGHSSSVDLRAAEGKRVIIVGGGTTAAQLALGAVSSGAGGVTLVSRRALRSADFDTAVGFSGGSLRMSFQELRSPAERLKFCRRARQGGSIPPYLRSSLQDEVAAGRVELLEQAEVTAVEQVAHGRGSEWKVTVSSSPFRDERQNGLPELPREPFHVDLIWLACGTAANCAADPLLRSILRRHPAAVVGGYPSLKPSSLWWPGLDMLVVGRLSAVSIGPSAAQLSGMREAAEEAAACVVGLFPQLCATKKIKAGVLGNLPADNSGAAQGQDPQDEGDDQGLPLEGEVLQEEAPPQQPRVLDAGELPPHLPRVNLGKFSWSDEEFIITVYIPVPEPVPADRLWSSLLERSIDLWVTGDKAAYHFQALMLYEKVIVDRSGIRYSPKKQMVIIKLHKYHNNPWRFLRQ